MFDLDRVFSEFESPEYGSLVNKDFIANRLRELPPGTRQLLSWAAILGGVFSFSIVRKLMNAKTAPSDAPHIPLLRDTDDGVSALNAALSAFIIMPANEEDWFRFSHDRYLTAALSSLEEQWDTTTMHYSIAKLMATNDGQSDAMTTASKDLYTQSRHICLATETIKARESQRASFRNILYQAAETACDSGARSTGIYYYAHCLLLLQDDPWDDNLPDVSYQETLQLFVRAAECYFHQGMIDEAQSLIRTTFKHARDACDMASSFILQSRIYALRGDHFGAFQSLKDCCSLLGTPIPPTTWEECDTHFQQICALLQSTDKEQLLSRPLSSDDRMLVTFGPIAVELLNAAFWSNSLLFFQATLMLVDLHLRQGTVTQMSLGYIHLGSIAGGRFGMIEFAVECGAIAKRLFALHPDDNLTIGRGQTLHSLFLGHLSGPLSECIFDLNSKFSHFDLFCCFTDSIEKAASAMPRLLVIISCY